MPEAKQKASLNSAGCCVCSPLTYFTSKSSIETVGNGLRSTLTNRQAHGAHSSLEVTRPSINRSRRCLTSVYVPLSPPQRPSGLLWGSADFYRSQRACFEFSSAFCLIVTKNLTCAKLCYDRNCLVCNAWANLYVTGLLGVRTCDNKVFLLRESNNSQFIIHSMTLQQDDVKDIGL